MIAFSADDGEHWTCVTSDAVPAAIKDPDVIAEMLDGNMAMEEDNQDVLWIACKTVDVLQRWKDLILNAPLQG